MQAEKALASLYICADSQEHSLLGDVISTEIMCTSLYKLVLIFFHPDSMTLSDQNVTTSPSGDSKKKNSVGTPAGQDMKRRRHKKKKPKKRKKNGRNGKTGTKINGNPDKSE